VAWCEIGFYLRNQLLHDADVMSAASSVELRVPFVDPEVLRAAWNVPGHWHRGRGGKHVLKALLHRLDPYHPVHRPKRGFVFPWEAWLRGPLGDVVAATLRDRDAHEALGIDAMAGQTLLGAWRRGDRRIGWAALWSHFVLIEWYRRTGADGEVVSSPERALA
jgi:asparagine synthase (glutamine-hydrolysing)